MADKKQTSLAAALLLAGGLAGAGAHAKISPPLPQSAHPTHMRWLDEGLGKPNRFAVTIATQVGANAGEREIVCESDGSGPKINGVPTTDLDAVALCKGAASFGNTAISQATSLASTLVR